jgi:hypothetical protein
MKTMALIAALSLLALAAAACGDPEPAPETSAPETPAAAAATAPEQAVAAPEPQIRPDRRPLVEGPISADGLQAILGTGDLGVGRNRVAFVMTSEEGFVNEPVATVASRYFADGSGEGELKETVKTEFHPWPYGNRGMYTVDLDLDAAGKWGLDITVGDPSQGAQTAKLFFEVLDAPEAPPVGAPAPKSVSKTEADVASLKELATGGLQDADLYQATIADAVQNGLPTVIVFASPAFCTNAVCGPQVEVLQQLKDKYKGQANFVHVDFYENPDEIQGDLSRAVISTAVQEWRLPSIEWTFVIDRQGDISARFEGFATLNEIERAFLQDL